ncbi:MAG TPA: acyl-CoA dehydrogenase family protein [Candidatus Thermoplasmatota archaeon]|nr:acyl-CoA dehydrogenase family protein [Candidatus Thermoplasmatota archaeon]
MPVDFEPDEDQRMLLRALKDFVQAEVIPYQDKFRSVFADERRLLDAGGRLNADVLRVAGDIRRKSAKQGFYAMQMPEEVGGANVPKTTQMLALRDVFSIGLGFSMPVLASVDGPGRMHLHMDERQRERYLKPLMTGEQTTCFALTEPGAGSDVRAIQTTARKDGDSYVLNGNKHFVTNGPYAEFAVVFAKTDPEDKGYGGLSAFIVDRGTPGFVVEKPQDTIEGNGIQCEFRFEDCHVPAENVLGGEGAGFLVALSSINDTRVWIGGMCLGLMRFSLGRAIEYAKQREAFGRPIGKYQGVSFMLADAALECELAELLALKTAWMIDRGNDPIKETSMTKLYATEALFRVADAAIQVHGAMGVSRETELERILRLARAARIFEGTSEMQRATIAKTLGL